MGLYGVLGREEGKFPLSSMFCTDGTYIFESIFWVGVPGSGFYCYCKEIIHILKQLSE